jgi:molybdopterin/thiamine biosynthesis adenylyltransferase
MVDRTRTCGIYTANNWAATIIGVGGIGGVTAITLAKMGLNELVLVDGDTVDDVNIGTQFFNIKDIGFPKAEVLAGHIEDLADDVEVETLSLFVDTDIPYSMVSNPILISAVDSIAARQSIWKVIEGQPWTWYIDTRMGAEELLIYCVSRDNYAWYADMLAGQDDASVPDLPCTSRATFYCGMGAAACVGEIVRKIVTGMPLPRILSWNMVSFTMITIGG